MHKSNIRMKVLRVKNFISNSHEVVFEKRNALDRFKIVKYIQVTLHDVHYVNSELFKVLDKLVHLQGKETDSKINKVLKI